VPYFALCRPYRLLAKQIGRGYEKTGSCKLFRDFLDAHANIELTEKEIRVAFHKHAHNSRPVAAGLDDTNVAVAWLGKKHLRFTFGWPPSPAVTLPR
jgi:hypothetical protein